MCCCSLEFLGVGRNMDHVRTYGWLQVQRTELRLSRCLAGQTEIYWNSDKLRTVRLLMHSKSYVNKYDAGSAISSDRLGEI